MAGNSLHPLDLATAVTSWRWDIPTLILTLALAAWYWRATSRIARQHGVAGRDEIVPPVRRGAFFGGLLLWLLVAVSVVGVYDDELFWMRSLQIILLLMLVPYLLASGTPLTVLRESSGPGLQRRMERALAGGFARIATSPPATSVAILATPWLLYLTGWYPAMLGNAAVDQVTRLALVLLGFLYYYSRLQADPVPHRYSQMISLVITIAEVIFDATLGLVLWLGPLRAEPHYLELARTWGLDMRTDQIIGAGIFWILGDVIGLPFLFSLMRALDKDDRAHAAVIDAELDAQDAERAAAAEAGTSATTTGLWWENDPQLAERFRRR